MATPRLLFGVGGGLGAVGLIGLGVNESIFTGQPLHSMSLCLQAHLIDFFLFQLILDTGRLSLAASLVLVMRCLERAFISGLKAMILCLEFSCIIMIFLHASSCSLKFFLCLS